MYWKDRVLRGVFVIVLTGVSLIERSTEICIWDKTCEGRMEMICSFCRLASKTSLENRISLSGKAELPQWSKILYEIENLIADDG